MQTGIAKTSPSLAPPELQLLWGAAMATAISDPNVTAVWPDSHHPSDWSQSAMWQQLARTPELATELTQTQLEMAAVTRSSFHVDWGTPPAGYPGVGYYCAPEAGYINLDLVWCLLFGIEHARAAVMHEMAHGVGTLEFTPKMIALLEQMEQLKESQADWEQETHIEFAKLNAEFQARFQMMDEEENNYANRFAVKRGAVSAQNYGDSLNHIEPLMVEALARIPSATGLVADDISATTSPQPELTGFDYEYFLNLKRAIRYSFFVNNGFVDDTPAGWAEVNVDANLLTRGLPDDKRAGRDGQELLRSLQADCLKLEEAQPEPHDRMFGSAYFEQINLAHHRARNAVIDAIFAERCEHLMPALHQEVEQQAETIAAIIAALNQLTEAIEAVIEIEGLGKISIKDLPAATPQEARQGKPCEHKDDKATAEDGQPNDEMVERGIRTKQFDAPTAGEGPKKQAEAGGKGGGGDGPGKTYSEAKLEILPPGDYNEYQKIILPHRRTVQRLSKIFTGIQDKIRQQQEAEFRRNTLLPEDGGLDRFDSASLHDRLIKQNSGQSVAAPDFEHFRRTVPQPLTNPPAEIVIFIDGSGSMSGEPVRMAITAGCILYESAKAADMKVWVAMLGCKEPYKLAKPGDSSTEIGQRVAAVQKGEGGDNDFLLPALQLSLEHTLNRPIGRNSQVGNTHVIVVSDGGFSDCYHGGVDELEKVQRLALTCPHLTIDYLLIGNRQASIVQSATKAADEVTRRAGKRKMGYQIISKDMSELQPALTALLLARLRALPEGLAPTLAQKKTEFHKAHLQL